MDFVNLFEWIQTVRPEALPERFTVNYGEVTGRTKWLEALQADATYGPDGPRAKWGAVQADMRRVWELCN